VTAAARRSLPKPGQRLGKIDPSFIDLSTMRADVAAAQGANPPAPPAGKPFRMYASDVRVRPTPSTTGTPVGTLRSPTTVYVVCQAVGETVSSGGYTNNR